MFVVALASRNGGPVALKHEVHEDLLFLLPIPGIFCASHCSFSSGFSQKLQLKSEESKADVNILERVANVSRFTNATLRQQRLRYSMLCVRALQGFFH